MNHDIDTVVNFAAESHVDRSIEDPGIFLKTNIIGTQTLMDVAKAHWTNGKDSAGYPTFTEEISLKPRSLYATSKTGADMLVRAYAETYHFPVNVTRCSNNYGPFHFPEKLIPLIIKNILTRN